MYEIEYNRKWRKIKRCRIRDEKKERETGTRCIEI